MSRSILRIACGLLIMLVIVGGLAACGDDDTPSAPDYADEIVESTIQAIDNGDYDTYLRYFTPAAQSAVTEEDFNTNVQLINDAYGNYTGKEFWRTAPENGYIGVHYKVTYSGTTEVLILSAYFKEIDGEMYLAGFWLAPQN